MRAVSEGKIDEKLVIGGAEKNSASEVLEVEGIRGHWKTFQKTEIFAL